MFKDDLLKDKRILVTGGGTALEKKWQLTSQNMVLKFIFVEDVEMFWKIRLMS